MSDFSTQRNKKRGGGRKTLHPARASRVKKNQKRHSHRLHAIDDTEAYLAEDGMPIWKALIRLLLGFLFFIPCIAVTSLVALQFRDENVLESVWNNSYALCFIFGGAISLFLHLIPKLRELLLKPYVFGHEVTHAIFVYFCYGKVSEFESSPEGGYIIANRDNILVSLSPYVFPFWSVIVGLFFIISGTVMDVTPALPYFFMLFGATWVFNVIWTGLMIPLGQSDLRNNGTFFSLTLIYLSNVLILSLLLEYARFNPSFTHWFYKFFNIHLDLFNLLITR